MTAMLPKWVSHADTYYNYELLKRVPFACTHAHDAYKRRGYISIEGIDMIGCD